LKSQILGLLALQPAATVIEHAWFAAARLAHGQSERVRATKTRVANKPIKIISFHPSDFAWIQSSDWHGMSAHQRYYGRSSEAVDVCHAVR
jgi:hypothetical protein